MLRAYVICRNLLLAIALLLTGMVLVASPASAHHPLISGTAVCNSATGKYDVTWTIESDADRDKNWLLTSVSRAIGITTPTAAQDDQTDFTGRETVDPGAGTLSLTVAARWQDKADSSRGVATATQTGSVTVPATRCDPDAKDASAVISTTPPGCGVGERLVLGATQHATWGVPSRTEGPGTYVVVATAVQGHQFADGTRTQEFRGTLAGPLPDDNGPSFPGCDRPDQPDPSKRQETADRSSCDLRDVGGTEFWTDEWTTTYVWSDQSGWTAQETGPVRIAEWFVPFTDDEYFAECAPVQPADLVREVPGEEESCELQGATSWVDVYTTPAVWNPETRAWELGEETGPVRTDEEYVAWSDERFEEECAEEPEVRGEEADVLQDEVSTPEVKGEQAVVPTVVDAGLTSNQNPLDVGLNPWWLVTGMFLGLMSAVGVRRRRAANR